MTSRSQHRRPILVYLTGFFLTNVGVGGFTLATGLALYRETGTASTFGVLVGVEYALGLVGQLVGGSILDRRDVLQVALVANTARGLAVLAGGAAFWVGGAIVPLMAVFMVSAFIRPLYRSASFVLVRHVCPSDELPRVNALRFGLLQAAQLTGLAVVAGCFAVLPAGTVICAVAVFLLAGSTVFLLLRGAVISAGGAGGTESGRPATFGQNWRELGAVLAAVPGLRVHLVLGAAPSVFVALSIVLVAPVNAAADGGSFGVALLDGGASVGALLTIFVVRRLPRIHPALVGLACALAVAGLLLLAGGHHLAVAVVAFLLLGTATALGATTLDTLLQLRTAPVVLGRLSVAQECVVSLSAICLIPFSGPLLGQLGLAPAAFVYAGIAFCYFGLYLAATAVLRGRLFGQYVNPRAVAANPAGSQVPDAFELEKS